MAKLPKTMPKPKSVQLVMPQNLVATPKQKAATMPAFKLKKPEDPFKKKIK